MFPLSLFIGTLLLIVFVDGFNPQHRSRSVLSPLTALFGGGPIRGDTLPLLLRTIESSEKGVLQDSKEEVIDMINMIGQQNAKFVQNDRTFLDKISGKWELLWTTEKETLFFINKGLFGKAVTNVYQTIDFKQGIINNLIEFESDRVFSVLGTIEKDVSINSRINFKFSKAVITVPPFPSLSLPPVGSGWFDNVYANEKYRLSKDVRGDYLISRRVQ